MASAEAEESPSTLDASYVPLADSQSSPSDVTLPLPQDDAPAPLPPSSTGFHLGPSALLAWWLSSLLILLLTSASFALSCHLLATSASVFRLRQQGTWNTSDPKYTPAYVTNYLLYGMSACFSVPTVALDPVKFSEPYLYRCAQPNDQSWTSLSSLAEDAPVPLHDILVTTVIQLVVCLLFVMVTATVSYCHWAGLWFKRLCPLHQHVCSLLATLACSAGVCAVCAVALFHATNAYSSLHLKTVTDAIGQPPVYVLLSSVETRETLSGISEIVAMNVCIWTALLLQLIVCVEHTRRHCRAGGWDSCVRGTRGCGSCVRGSCACAVDSRGRTVIGWSA